MKGELNKIQICTPNNLCTNLSSKRGRYSAPLCTHLSSERVRYGASCKKSCKG